MAFRRDASRLIRNTFTALGVILSTLIVVGFVLDVRSFDQTRGGYEPPYTDYTGEPVNWDELDLTTTGMARRGYVVNILIDCTTGMMGFEVFKLRIPFRQFSPRALAVHRPHEACAERGFTPEF